jgi:hypothetical protein
MKGCCHTIAGRASLPPFRPMRARYLRCFFGCIFLHSLGAQEPSAVPPAAAVRFRAAALGHDVLLREGGASSAPTNPRFKGVSLPAGAQDLELQLTTSTPYDRFFGSVRSVIGSLDPQRATMAKACHLMKVGYSFQYASRDPYRPDPPRLTEAQHAGDCKSKALWLYDNLADAGALFTIGKVERNSRTSHAWVYWRHGERWWILDCTDRSDPIAADSVSSDRYVPYYSFGKNGTYRHQTTTLNAAPTAVVGSAASAKRSR